MSRAALAWALLLLTAASVAQAQTTVNPQALDQLAPPPPPATHAPPRRTARSSRSSHPATHRAAPAHAAAPHNGGKPNPHAALTPAASAKPRQTAAMPATAPPPPVLPPPIVVPTRPVLPPEPASVVSDAPGNAIPQTGGERITFGVGRADLNPATDAALRALAHLGPPFVATTYSVTAYAAGDANDPSTPRRLSLERALAVRSVLIHEGVPSTRIYVRALGASVPAGDSPPDRVDIVAITPEPAQAPAAPP